MTTNTTWAVILMASLWFWSGPFCCYCYYSAQYDSKSDNNDDQDLNIYHHHHKNEERVKNPVISKWSDVEKIVSSREFQNDDDRIEINIFLLILNPYAKYQQKRMSKQRRSKNRKLASHDHHHHLDNDDDEYQKHYSYEIITQFRYSAIHFHSVTDKYNLIGDNDVGQKKFFHFIIIDNDDDDDDANSLHKQYTKMFNYLRQHSAINERTNIDQWQRERHPFMLVKLSNHGANVEIMKNYDQPYAIMMIFWYGKICRLSLIKYFETAHNQLSNTVNIAILLLSMITLIIGQRSTFPYFQQLTLLPTLLYPIGFVWNQIHGASNNGGQNLFTSIIRIIPSSNGQLLSESFLIMAINFTFSYCLYMYTKLALLKHNDGSKLKPNSSNQFPKGKHVGHFDNNNTDNNHYATYMIILMAISFWIVNAVFNLKLS